MYGKVEKQCKGRKGTKNTKHACVNLDLNWYPQLSEKMHKVLVLLEMLEVEIIIVFKDVLTELAYSLVVLV